MVSADPNSKSGSNRTWSLKWRLGVIGLVLGLFALLLLPWGKKRTDERRPPEWSVMTGIVGALAVYAAENNGNWPTSLSPWISKHLPNKPRYYGLPADVDNIAEYFIYFPNHPSISPDGYRLVLMTGSSITRSNQRGFGRWSMWLMGGYDVLTINWLTEDKAQAYLRAARSAATPSSATTHSPQK
jgi:hypothetical protein